MNRVVLMPALTQVFQRVSLVKLERVARLELDVYSNHVKASTVVSHRRATRTAEQVK